VRGKVGQLSFCSYSQSFNLAHAVTGVKIFSHNSLRLVLRFDNVQSCTTTSFVLLSDEQYIHKSVLSKRIAIKHEAKSLYVVLRLHLDHFKTGK